MLFPGHAITCFQLSLRGDSQPTRHEQSSRALAEPGRKRPRERGRKVSPPCRGNAGVWHWDRMRTDSARMHGPTPFPEIQQFKGFERPVLFFRAPAGGGSLKKLMEQVECPSEIISVEEAKWFWGFPINPNGNGRGHATGLPSSLVSSSGTIVAYARDHCMSRMADGQLVGGVGLRPFTTVTGSVA